MVYVATWRVLLMCPNQCAVWSLLSQPAEERALNMCSLCLVSTFSISGAIQLQGLDTRAKFFDDTVLCNAATLRETGTGTGDH